MDIKNIKTAVIAGAGLMGSSIAQILASRGYEAVLYGTKERQLERSRSLIALYRDELIEQGKMSKEQAEAQPISHTLDKDIFKQADLVIETITEKLELKQDFWREASEIVPEDALLTSNTSGLSLTAISRAVKNPRRFIGLHWVNPPHLIPLVEVIRADSTGDETAQAVCDFAVSLDRKPVLVKKDAPGFVLNRIQFAVLREAMHIVDSGIASMEDVDTVLKYGLGMRYAAIGPFETADFGGLDTFYRIASYLFPELSDAKTVSPLLSVPAVQGDYGVKTGRGFYDYSDGKGEAATKRRDQLFLKLADCLYGSESK